MKRNDWQENHQLTSKRNHSHCNHLSVVKTWEVVSENEARNLVLR